ncbi:MAG: GNAT family N-acetyltransferase [Sedimenticola sp.]|nr:GNAT family N-acetyltransferase [Sedimenticola sp.]
MEIYIAQSDRQIADCYPVMSLLRPHLLEEEFVSRVRAQQSAGYQLAVAGREGETVAVAGFRVSENLAWGRFLYVDDLVTAQQHRSQGVGRELLGWLREYAASRGCREVHLDSGMQRQSAHRFYLREGMDRAGYHFAQTL